jgi:pyridoxamine 5'-phosphate oxidase family protein
MASFTEAQIQYIQSQRLGRLATLGPDGAPHVVPNSVRYNPELGTLDLGGLNLGKTRKWRDVARDPRVAVVIDDVLPPWIPRGVEVRGRAEQVPQGGEIFGPHFGPEMIRIRPDKIVSWGLGEK